MRPTYSWSMVLVDAQIDSSRDWDGFLANPKPDVFIEASLGAFSGKSSTMDNTYTPAWNEVMFTTAASNFNGMMHVVVKDSDTFGTDTIADFMVVVDDNSLGNGEMLLVYPAANNTDLIQLRFQFIANIP